MGSKEGAEDALEVLSRERHHRAKPYPSPWLALPDRQGRDHRPAAATDLAVTGREARAAALLGRTTDGQAHRAIRQPLPEGRLPMQPQSLLQRLARRTRQAPHHPLHGLQTRDIRTLAQSPRSPRQGLPTRSSIEGNGRQVMPSNSRNGSTRSWRRIRAIVLARDSGICWMCGQPGADTVDHLLPVEHGGTDDLWNLAACHGKRGPGCVGNYARGSKRRLKGKRRSGATPTPGALSLADHPSPYPGGYTYNASKRITRERKSNDREEG